MRRFLIACPLLALALALTAPATPAAAATNVSIGINLGNAPPPPVVVWRHEPRMVLVPGSTVYYYAGDCDYDYFQYGMYYYAYHDDCWYRARYWRGPFRAIHTSYVPRAFYRLHDRGYHWRHPWRGVPEGRMVQVSERKQHHKHGHGHGKHGHGHDDD